MSWHARIERAFPWAFVLVASIAVLGITMGWVAPWWWLGAGIPAMLVCLGIGALWDATVDRRSTRRPPAG